MPKIGTGTQDEGMLSHSGRGFSFTATRLERLGATEYTLVTIAVDVTGSTATFTDSLRLSLVTAVKSCKKSPRSDNLLVRAITFSTVGGVVELHGFKPLSEIDPDKDYPHFKPDGLTPLFDATFSAVASMVEYGQQLKAGDFGCNGIVFIITDGDDNSSSATPGMINDQLSAVKRGEKLESLYTVLIGVNAARFKDKLEQFQKDAGLDQYVDAGDATPGKLAKLANFVSQSVSSASQALGSGGPSQAISATI